MKHMGHTRAAAFCIALGAVVSTMFLPAGATTLRRMDLPQLIESAERVVHARVLERRAYWNPEGTKIFTDTVFEVLQDAKGRGPRQITIKLLGGQVGIIDLHVEGTPVFEIGEEAVLFTEPRPDGKNHLVGLSQGVMRVVEDPRSGERVALGEVYGGVQYLENVGGQLRSVRPSTRNVALDVLMDHVREAADRGGDPPMLKSEPSHVMTESAGGGK